MAQKSRTVARLRRDYLSDYSVPIAEVELFGLNVRSLVIELFPNTP
jgi:hypothetical protein